MRKLLAAALIAVVGGFAVAAELKSGPQTGEKVPGPFHPLNVNGEDAGQKACLYCRHGDNAVAMVFARTPECPQTLALINKLEKLTAANAKKEMGSYVVFLSDDDKTADKLKKVAESAKLKFVTLAVDNPSGPNKYNVAKEADLTIVLYKDRKVEANFAFEKGKITDKDIEAVVAGVEKLNK